jgi:hypothetical protein
MKSKKHTQNKNYKLILMIIYISCSLISLFIIKNNLIEMFNNYLILDYFDKIFMLVKIILFIFLCFFSSFLPLIIQKNEKMKKMNFKQIFFIEQSDLIYSDYKFSKKDIEINVKSLLFLLITSIIILIISRLINLIINTNEIIIESILIITILTSLLFYYNNIKVKSKEQKRLIEFILRYILELPRLIISIIILNIMINPSILLILISIGSLFYLIIYRGLFLFEILVTSIFLLLNINLYELILFIILNRIIGSIVILIPYVINNFIKLLIQKKNQRCFQ